MAEKYGVVPPKFTKAWWEYFWDYYKWFVISGVIVILLVLITISQCSSAPKYDMKVTYAGSRPYSDEDVQKTENIISEFAGDTNEDGEISVGLTPLVFSNSVENSEYNYALVTKLTLTFSDHYSFLFLMDKEQAEAQLAKEDYDGLFNSLDEYAPSDADVIKGEDGKIYAVSLKNSKLMTDNNIKCDDLYILVRLNYKEDEHNIAVHEQSLKAAEALLQ